MFFVEIFNLCGSDQTTSIQQQFKSLFLHENASSNLVSIEDSKIHEHEIHEISK